MGANISRLGRFWLATAKKIMHDAQKLGFGKTSTDKRIQHNMSSSWRWQGELACCCFGCMKRKGRVIGYSRSQLKKGREHRRCRECVVRQEMRGRFSACCGFLFLRRVGDYERALFEDIVCRCHSAVSLCANDRDLWIFFDDILRGSRLLRRLTRTSWYHHCTNNYFPWECFCSFCSFQALQQIECSTLTF